MSLQDYQLSLMVCEQQNKNRLKMAKEAPPENRKTVEWAFPPPGTLKSAEPWSFTPPADASAPVDASFSYASGGTPTSYDLSGPVSYAMPGPANPSKKKANPSKKRRARAEGSSLAGGFTRSAGGSRSSHSFEMSVKDTDSSDSPTAMQYTPSQYVAPLARSLPPGVSAQYAPSPSTSPGSPPYQGSGKRLACVLGSAQPSSSARSPAPEPPAPQTPQEVMHALISHQDFSGAFRFDARVLAWLGVSVDAFQHKREGCGPASERDDASTVLLTALAVVYFERKLAEFGDEWELVVEKARSWLEGVGADVALVFKNAAGELVEGK